MVNTIIIIIIVISNREKRVGYQQKNSYTQSLSEKKKVS